MATVTTLYRCPVTPDDCPTSPRRGYCRIHEWEQLVPERQYLTASEASDQQDGSIVPAPDSGHDAPGRGAEGSGGPSGSARQDATRSRHTGPESTTRQDATQPRHPGPESTTRPPGSRPGTPAPAAPAPPTRLQSPAGRGGRPAPAAPCLALVMAGVLVPVRAAEQGPTPLGRDSPDCAHVPGLAALDQLSRAHAEVYWDAGLLYLADKGSSNGTFVDGERLTRPVQLWPGNHRVHLAQAPEAVDISLVELDEFGGLR
ncbi:FHA domain-containing protein [Streptomyces kunmingensis]|uniref:FHA domain-containing protein n=1 Tax=Streptomyces kunmingensis TaxID=68225 RepID=A0ABU6CIM8_9ACTN|nr:FHA domain-containing protein [Streptomyces kunmingensis]MEB3964548.1 FHA domain-containing protein [Streptomyces kunmingensis]